MYTETKKCGLFPYVISFVVDLLLLPILFIGAFLLFVEHSLFLFFLIITHNTKFHALAIITVLLLQTMQIYITIDCSSYFGYIAMLYIVVPVWMGFFLSRTSLNNKGN